MVYSTRRFLLNLALCYFVLAFFQSFEHWDYLTRGRECFSYVCLICACMILSVSLPLGVWEGLRLVHSLDLSLTTFSELWNMYSELLPTNCEIWNYQI